MRVGPLTALAWAASASVAGLLVSLTLVAAPARAQVAADWCVFQRTVFDSNGQPLNQATVAQCNQQAPGLPAEWRPVANNLPFAAAGLVRDTINAANVATSWCVIQRQVPSSAGNFLGRPRRQYSVILCKDIAGAGPGWFPVAQNVTYGAATAIASAGNVAETRPASIGSGSGGSGAGGTGSGGGTGGGGGNNGGGSGGGGTGSGGGNIGTQATGGPETGAPSASAAAGNAAGSAAIGSGGGSGGGGTGVGGGSTGSGSGGSGGSGGGNTGTQATGGPETGAPTPRRLSPECEAALYLVNIRGADAVEASLEYRDAADGKDTAWKETAWKVYVKAYAAYKAALREADARCPGQANVPVTYPGDPTGGEGPDNSGGGSGTAGGGQGGTGTGGGTETTQGGQGTGGGEGTGGGTTPGSGGQGAGGGAGQGPTNQGGGQGTGSGPSKTASAPGTCPQGLGWFSCNVSGGIAVAWCLKTGDAPGRASDVCFGKSNCACTLEGQPITPRTASPSTPRPPGSPPTTQTSSSGPSCPVSQWNVETVCGPLPYQTASLKQGAISCVPASASPAGGAYCTDGSIGLANPPLGTEPCGGQNNKIWQSTSDTQLCSNLFKPSPGTCHPVYCQDNADGSSNCTADLCGRFQQHADIAFPAPLEHSAQAPDVAIDSSNQPPQPPDVAVDSAVHPAPQTPPDVAVDSPTPPTHQQPEPGPVARATPATPQSGGPSDSGGTSSPPPIVLVVPPEQPEPGPATTHTHTPPTPSPGPHISTSDPWNPPAPVPAVPRTPVKPLGPPGVMNGGSCHTDNNGQTTCIDNPTPSTPQTPPQKVAALPLQPLPGPKAAPTIPTPSPSTAKPLPVEPISPTAPKAAPTIPEPSPSTAKALPVEPVAPGAAKPLPTQPVTPQPTSLPVQAAAQPNPLPPAAAATPPKPAPPQPAPPEAKSSPAEPPPPPPLPNQVATVEPPPVQPACSKTVVHFDVARHDSVTVEETVVGGAFCHNGFIAAGSTRFTGASIAVNPSNGTLQKTGGLDFRFQPHQGYKGSDRYAVKICGRSKEGSGCATVTYEVTVQ
jgi:hypothetical protein